MRTVNVVLSLCLNIGVDPPDVVKTDPCARLECWLGGSGRDRVQEEEEGGREGGGEWKEWKEGEEGVRRRKQTIAQVIGFCTYV